MRKNEYNSIEEFKSQYTGAWDPSEGHWLGLDFSFNGSEYRFNTGPMYESENTILPDGREALFGLYKRDSEQNGHREYVLLAEFASIDDALDNTSIEGLKFSEVIMDDNTELLGQD